MSVFETELTLEFTPEELFAWHMRPAAFERLVPPWQDIRVIDRRGTIRDGDSVEFEFHVGPIPVRWRARHEGFIEGRRFCDVQERGPFAQWNHTHLFEPADGGCTLKEIVEYRLPLDGIGLVFGGWKAGEELERLFWFRHERLRRDLERHRKYSTHPLRIVISGASGLLGSALVPFLLTGGHEVHRLVRREPGGENEISWDPGEGKLDPKAMEGFDVLINLSGENIASGRWTPARKKAILQSRTDSAGLLSETLARLSRPPEVFLCASAAGYYEMTDSDPKTDASGKGTGFLPEVCEQWEAACGPARKAGVRVVNFRLSAVLTPAGGLLEKMLPVFRKGLGGPVGSGDQGLSWISMDDVLGAILFLISHTDIEGPVNLTSPQPVSNEGFTRTLGRVLRRPTPFRVPSFVVRGVFGEMGEEIMLNGSYVIPDRLQRKGFEFLEPALESALRWEMGIRLEEGLSKGNPDD
jgi:uncharacterized protein (TIGR01777 family)